MGKFGVDRLRVRGDGLMLGRCFSRIVVDVVVGDATTCCWVWSTGREVAMGWDGMG